MQDDFMQGDPIQYALMQEGYDCEKLAKIRDKYRQKRDKAITLKEIFTPEEHLYIMKYCFEYVLREMGSTRKLTYDEVLKLLEIISDDQELI